MAPGLLNTGDFAGLIIKSEIALPNIVLNFL